MVFWKNRNQPSGLPISSSTISDSAQQADKIAVPPKVIENQADQAQKSDVAENSALEGFVDLRAPFILQAPFGNWDDFVFQNACEEASIAMAMGWIRGVQNISPAEAEKQILDIVGFENSEFGYNTDTDVFDMQIIFQKHFKHQNVSTQKNISIQDIKDELHKGNLIIVPAYGRALKNPNYSGAGPIAHMLVIAGYDPQTEEFITNDPGTRKGAGYRYGENALFSAIWNYPSSQDNIPEPAGPLEKVMLIVGK